MAELTTLEPQLEGRETQLESIPTEREESFTQVSSAMESLQTFQEYNIVEQLPSQGAESDIYIVEKEKKQYILKLYRFGIQPKKEILEQLVSLSKKHPQHFVKIYETGFDEALERWFEIQEYVKNGSLRDFKEEISQERLYRIIEELVEILHQLHSNKILHRDIKPENILLRSIEPLDLVITDFGISSLLDDATNIWTSKQGTYRYFAPESFSGVIGKAMDYWSLGMIIYALANGGKHYFDGISNEHTIQLHITTKNIELPEHFDENLRQLLSFLFCKNPENRADYALVKKWLTGEDLGKPKNEEAPLEEKEGYPFDGRKYSDFKALAQTVSRSYKNWQLFADHLSNGSLLTWAKEHKQYDKYTLIDNLVGKKRDLMVLEFVYAFNPEIKEFRLFGKVITLSNLHLFMQNYLSSEYEKGEESIYNALISGEIRELYHHYLAFTNKKNTFSWIFLEIYNYMKEREEDGLSKRKIFQFLDFVAHEDEYLLPSNKKEITIQNFEIFFKKESLFKDAKISKSFIDSLEELSLKELKGLKKMTLMNFESYYYPSDFFEHLEKDFKTTLPYLDYFVKKSAIEDIEKRYYIPNEGVYQSYIQEIKKSSLEEYIKSYNALKSFKKEYLLLKTQLEEAKKKKKLFELFGINIDYPQDTQMSKIKMILDSNMDERSYRKIEAINSNKVHPHFALYLTKMENLQFKMREEDKKIISFIQLYRGKLYTVRILFILSFLSVLIATSFDFSYLVSSVVMLVLITISYILLINRIVSLPVSAINRIGNVIQVQYGRRRELSHQLIVWDNLLLSFVIWGSIFYLGYVVVSLVIDFFMAIGELFTTVSGDKQ